MFHQHLLSPKLKRSAIISNKHGICELPHELPNDVGLKIGSLKKSVKLENLLQL